jgi:GNAT superfamily N-acetyltransferase
MDRVLALMVELYKHDAIPFDEARARKAIKGLLARPPIGQIWLIDWDGEDAGYLVLTIGYSLEFGGRFALLDEFLVAQRWRGQGIGTEVLGFVEQWCRRREIHAIRLEVGHENLRALELYKRAGFVVHDRHFMTKRL